MTQEFSSSCPIVRRGCAAGALWGGAIGAVAMSGLAVFHLAALLSDLVPVATGVGALVGAFEGMVSGVVLALREQGGQRGDRNRRVAAVIVAVAIWSVVAIVLFAQTSSPAGLAVVVTFGTVGAHAGALLAPCVVRGRAPRG